MSGLLKDLSVSKARKQYIDGTKTRLQKKIAPLCVEFQKDRKALDQFEIWSENIKQVIIKDAFAFVVKCQREQFEPDVVELISNAMNMVIGQMPKIISDSSRNVISEREKA